MPFSLKRNDDTLPDPHRWQEDIYIGWAPWRFARWWAANKFWLISAFVFLPLIFLVINGVFSMLLVAGSLIVAFFVRVLRDRKRGIGFTKNNEIVVFGPHTPIVLPASTLQSLGVMKVNRFLAFKLQRRGDEEILPDQDKWYQKLFGYAGFKSEAPIRAKDAAAAREMSLASGKGLLFVVRDKNTGTFWTVSTATGYEVATLRDLAALTKVKFISPDDPFSQNRTPAVSTHQRRTKRERRKKNRPNRTSQVNKARLTDLPDEELLRRYGVHALRSPSRFRSFVLANTRFRDGKLPEQWLPEIGIQEPSEAEIKKGRIRTRSLVSSGVVFSFLLFIVAPIVGMVLWPASTGGFITSSWPRPYERLWDSPTYLEQVKNEGDYSEFAFLDKEGTVRYQIGVISAEEGNCSSVLQDAIFNLYVEEGVEELPEFQPPTQNINGWEMSEVLPGRVVGCSENAVGDSGRLELRTIDITGVSLEEGAQITQDIKTRLNE